MPLLYADDWSRKIYLKSFEFFLLIEVSFSFEKKEEEDILGIKSCKFNIIKFKT